jgi:hypothetical protein
MRMLAACAIAAVIVPVAVATPTEAGHKRREAIVVGITAVPIPHPYGLYGYPVYGYSPIHTDPLCIWRHQLVCNPWYCRERKMRVCY